MQPMAVLFDFGGTLDADGLRWSVRVHSAYRAAGGTLSLEEFEPLFRKSDRRLETLPGIRRMGLMDTVRAQAGILKQLVADGSSIDVERTAAVFCAESLAIATRNRPVLDRLAARVPLGVVSNFTGNLDHCLAELELREYFHVTLDSALVGATKPSPEIFRMALARLGVPAEGVWMVGDNFDADILPAAALGLSTCWLAPVERPEPSPGIATARIGNLTDLSTVIC
jgi:putative hydrolase of the HAD superfamily